jgi:hypothetical protein
MPNDVIQSIEAMAGANGGIDMFDITWGGEAPKETDDAAMAGEDDFIPVATGVNAPQQV